MTARFYAIARGAKRGKPIKAPLPLDPEERLAERRRRIQAKLASQKRVIRVR